MKELSLARGRWEEGGKTRAISVRVQRVRTWHNPGKSTRERQRPRKSVTRPRAAMLDVNKTHTAVPFRIPAFLMQSRAKSKPLWPRRREDKPLTWNYSNVSGKQTVDYVTGRETLSSLSARWIVCFPFLRRWNATECEIKTLFLRRGNDFLESPWD